MNSHPGVSNALAILSSFPSGNVELIPLRQRIGRMLSAANCKPPDNSEYFMGTQYISYSRFCRQYSYGFYLRWSTNGLVYGIQVGDAVLEGELRG